MLGFVLTIHGKPKAVLIGRAEDFLEHRATPVPKTVCSRCNLKVLVQGLESSGSTSEIDERQKAVGASERGRVRELPIGYTVGKEP